jgi:hypothetical protein
MLFIFDLRRSLWRTVRCGVLLGLFAALLIPALAAASAAVPAPTLVFPWQQVWPIVIGGLVPLVTYVLNHVGPWLTEPIKALVLVLVSAIATALYTALATKVFGLNNATLQLVLTGVFASLFSHKLLWLPSGISTLLGGGTNRQAVVGGGAVKQTPAVAPPAQPATPVRPDAPQA